MRIPWDRGKGARWRARQCHGHAVNLWTVCQPAGSIPVAAWGAVLPPAFPLSLSLNDSPRAGRYRWCWHGACSAWQPCTPMARRSLSWA